MSAPDIKASNETQSIQHTRAALKDALESGHPLVQKALSQERNLRQRKVKELTDLTTLQEAYLRKQGGELILADIKKKVSEKLALDTELLAILNKAVDDLPAKVKEKASIPLKINKMHLVIAGAQQLLNSAGFFDKIFYGKVPSGYALDYQSDAITLLGDNTTRFGNAKGVFHEALALTTYLVCTGKNNLSEINLLESEAGPWHKRSALVYDAVVPTEIELNQLNAQFSKFTYSYQGRFGYIHGDYAFGGGRDGNKTNLWAPLDCSAWIASVTGSKIFYSTADQVCFDKAYRFRLMLNSTQLVSNAALNKALNTQEPKIVPKDWVIGQGFSVMDALYEPINQIKNPQKDIQAGQIYFHRRFDDTLPSKFIGTSGHTGLVLGFISDAEKSRVQVLSYERDLEGSKKIVGFGVSEFPLFPKPESATIRKQVYFSRLADDVAKAMVNDQYKSVLDGAAAASNKITIKKG